MQKGGKWMARTEDRIRFAIRHGQRRGEGLPDARRWRWACGRCWTACCAWLLDQQAF
jgi:hypothetical protein